ncbi:hypothetical protein [Catellatospora vulcania]|uniref:hypothetical protein n=1 Tax=Catellatospora vulcania TaxID=1460450 RepID=UPI0012D4817B|nr:hypothetical protein [Catellatospora vulcania]
MGATYKAAQLGADTLMTDGEHIHPVPPGTLDPGIGSVLNRLAGRFSDEGVVMVDVEAARAMRLPTTREGLGAVADDHELLREARSAGWEVRKLADWTTFRREGLTLRVGILPAIEPAAFPLLDPDPRDGMGTVTSLALWHRVTGSAYHGTAGIAGIAIMSKVTTVGPKKLQPTWKPKIELVPGFEDDFHADHFRAPASGMRFAHAYDANRAYIAAAANVIVAPWQLKPGGTTFDPKLGGWWLCELSPWNDKRMPDPAGYSSEKGARWISTATVTLLQDLTEQGVYGGVTIKDSRVSQGLELLRPWAWKMRDAYAAVPSVAEDSRDAERVTKALKEAGRKTLGMLASETNWIYRPDWWFSIIAMDRANRWRKMWKTGREQGRWPLWIDVDNVWYASDDEDGVAAVPAGWALDPSGMKLGAYKHKATRKSRAAVESGAK